METHHCFALLDIFLPEEELPVQIANVDGVHVDDMDVLEPGQGKVREDLATQSTSTNHKNLALVSEKVFDLKTVSSTRRAHLWVYGPLALQGTMGRCADLVCPRPDPHDSNDRASHRRRHCR